MTTRGYSGTPLARKLGYGPGAQVYLEGAPHAYRAWLEPLPDGVTFQARPGRTTTLAHVFVVDRDRLATRLRNLRERLAADASLWVSWPKQKSGVPTTVTEDVIREIAIPLGFVDVKVCAVDEVWSGLKLVVRKALR